MNCVAYFIPLTFSLSVIFFALGPVLNPRANRPRVQNLGPRAQNITSRLKVTRDKNATINSALDTKYTIDISTVHQAFTQQCRHLKIVCVGIAADSILSISFSFSFKLKLKLKLISLISLIVSGR